MQLDYATISDISLFVPLLGPFWLVLNFLKVMLYYHSLAYNQKQTIYTKLWIIWIIILTLDQWHCKELLHENSILAKPELQSMGIVVKYDFFPRIQINKQPMDQIVVDGDYWLGTNSMLMLKILMILKVNIKQID